MFDVVDIARIGEVALSRFEILLSSVNEGVVRDASGGRIGVITLEEAHGLARTVISQHVDFDPLLTARYVTQFPEILAMPLVGVSVADSISHALAKAVFDRVEPGLREAVVSQYRCYAVHDLDVAVANGLSMFDKYLVNDPFGRLRVRPDRLSACLAEIGPDCEVKQLKKFKWQIEALASELKTKPIDARNVARSLREAAQFCEFAVSGEVSLERDFSLDDLPLKVAV
jgi:hypothetical protein